MFVVAATTAVVLAVALVSSAARKLAGGADVVEDYRRAGVPEAWLPPLAAVLVLAACGVIAGLAVAPFGVAASAGLVAYFLLAVVAHLRAGDAAHVGTPVVMALLSAATLILRLATL